jgi:hypothetical protein
MDLKSIARNLERERCNVHNEHPQAVPQRDSINLSCCCETFKAKLVKKMESEISNQIEADLMKAFKF